MKKILSAIAALCLSTGAMGQPIGPNLAAGKPAQASSSEGARTAPRFAVDNNYSTRWASDRTNPATVNTQWLAVDLGSTYNITKVRVNWEAAYGRDFQIQVSPDGVAWTPAATTTPGQTATVVGNTARVNLISGIAASAKFVRVYCTARGTGYGYSIYELEVSNTNTAPTVILTQPAANSSYTGTINLAASATDPDGAVSNVDFYVDNVLVGTDTTSPYTAAWTNAPNGTHVAKAIATDDNGAATTAYEREFYVTGNTTNTPPAVVLTQPQAADYPKLSSITIAANATDSDGSVTQVAFYAGTTLLNVDTTSPYSYTWAAVPAGTYDITAVATDNGGAATTSIARRIQVLRDPPTLTVTSPVQNATYAYQQPIAISAEASADGTTVASVEFYSQDFNSVLLASFTTGPYTYSWANVAPGNHTIFVRVTDGTGRTTSEYRDITVANPANKTIPGKIEAESYDAQSGIQTEPTADAGGGLNVGYIDVGDYLDYNVSITTNDYYSVQFRVASWVAGAQLQLLWVTGLEGNAVKAVVTLPNTGGGQNWQTVTVNNVSLPVGNNKLRVKALTSGFNFNWMNFVQGAVVVRGTAALATGSGKADRLAESIMAYPNPSSGLVHLGGATDGTAATVTDQLGRTVLSTEVRNGSVDISTLRTGIYFLALKSEGKASNIRVMKE